MYFWVLRIRQDLNQSTMKCRQLINLTFNPDSAGVFWDGGKLPIQVVAHPCILPAYECTLICLQSPPKLVKPGPSLSPLSIAFPCWLSRAWQIRIKLSLHKISIHIVSNQHDFWPCSGKEFKSRNDVITSVGKFAAGSHYANRR
jgi:hypothetical protein